MNFVSEVFEGFFVTILITILVTIFITEILLRKRAPVFASILEISLKLDSDFRDFCFCLFS